MSKVSVIGSGNVGATAVYYLAERNLADIVMVDVVEGLPQSKGLDFLHSAPLRQYNVHIFGTNNFREISGSDVVILTAGVTRKPGMDRRDLVRTNAQIAKEASTAIVKYAPEAYVVVVTNPLDVIAYLVLRETGFEKNRIVGMAGILDSTRFRYFIAEKLDVSPLDVMAMVLGGHGDSMVPLKRFTSVGGFPISELMDEKTIDEIIERTREGGAEIVNYLKTGSAFYSPGASIAKMVQAIVKDEKTLVPASVYLTGEYGYSDIFLGVPVILGRRGVEKIIELELTDREKVNLDFSAREVKKGIEELDTII